MSYLLSLSISELQLLAMSISFRFCCCPKSSRHHRRKAPSRRTSSAAVRFSGTTEERVGQFVLSPPNHRFFLFALLQPNGICGGATDETKQREVPPEEVPKSTKSRTRETKTADAAEGPPTSALVSRQIVHIVTVESVGIWWGMDRDRTLFWFPSESGGGCPPCLRLPSPSSNLRTLIGVSPADRTESTSASAFCVGRSHSGDQPFGHPDHPDHFHPILFFLIASFPSTLFVFVITDQLPSPIILITDHHSSPLPLPLPFFRFFL